MADNGNELFRIFKSQFIDGTKIVRIRTASDLSETSFETAMCQYIDNFSETPDAFIVSNEDYTIALKIAKDSGRQLLVSSIPFIKEDAWALAGKAGIVWSPGA